MRFPNYSRISIEVQAVICQTLVDRKAAFDKEVLLPLAEERLFFVARKIPRLEKIRPERLFLFLTLIHRRMKEIIDTLSCIPVETGNCSQLLYGSLLNFL